MRNDTDTVFPDDPAVNARATGLALKPTLPIVPLDATPREAVRLFEAAGSPILPVGNSVDCFAVLRIQDIAEALCVQDSEVRSKSIEGLISLPEIRCRVNHPASDTMTYLRQRRLPGVPVFDSHDRMRGVVLLHDLLDLLQDGLGGPESDYDRRVRGSQT